MVVLAHCENGRVIDVLTRQLVERGELGIESLPRSRPIALEAECVHRFLVLAELAGRDALRRARHRARAARGDRRRARARPDGVRRGVPAPPAVRRVRPRGRRRGALRDDAAAAHRRRPRGAAATACATAASTRSPPTTATCGSTATSCRCGRLHAGSRPACRASPRACRSGSRSRRLRRSVERLVEVACAAPARIFGLYPRKGVIARRQRRRPRRLGSVGAGAAHARVIDDGLDWTPYGGIDVPGRIRYVLARGDRVVEDGRFSGDEHRGAYLPVSRVLETS